MQCCLNTPGTTLHRKMFSQTLKNMAQEKVYTIQAMSSEQQLITLFTYEYIWSFTSKIIKLSFLYSSLAFYPASDQTSCLMLSKQVKLNQNTVSARLHFLPGGKNFHPSKGMIRKKMSVWGVLKSKGEGGLLCFFSKKLCKM